MSYLEDKTTLFVLGRDSELSARGSQFKIKSGGELRSVPVVRILDIVVHNSVKVCGSALSLSAENSIPIHYVNNRGDYYGTFSDGLGANIFLRKRQYERRFDSEFCIAVAKRIVEGKRNNQQWVIDSLVDGLVLPGVDGAKSLESLLGLEGKISALYWDYFPKLIKNPDFEFKRRTKRPPSDEINALLSFGYVLLVNRITSLLLYVGLDPYLGFYHQDFYKRPALALDLMEEWRPLAVDKFVLTLINRREFKPDDFEREGAAVRLAAKPRNVFIAKWYAEWSKREFYSGAYKTKATLAKFCEWQCRKFSKVISGEIDSYQPFFF